MAKITYTRTDIQDLCDRLNARSGSVMLLDMPKLGSDIAAAARLLRKMLQAGMPPSSFEIETNGNGG